MSESCPICFALLSPHRLRRQNSVIQCSLAIERYAFNSKGNVGSLYDCWIDNISFISSLDKNFITEKETSNVVSCRVINDDMLNDDDLLQILGIDDELWISIALNMISATEGMAMLYNYQLPAEHRIRFLHYNRIDRQARLFDDDAIVKNILVKSLSNTKATHIITDVKQGIDFVIALEFSISENSHKIDSILEKICKYFVECESDFLSLEEQEIINRLTPIIFTQITEIYSLQNTKNLSEMCQYIHQYLFEQKDNIPLFYTLHPVKIPCSDDSLDGGTFIPLDSSIIKNIKKIVLKLFNKLKTIKHSFYEIQSVSLPQHLQNHYDKVFENLNKVKSIYDEVRNRLAKIVVKFRRQATDPSSFDKELKNLPHETLNSELDNLSEVLVELKNKARFITELETKYCLKYYNVADLEEKDDDQRTLETKILSFHYQQLTHFLCSSDELRNKDIIQHEKLCQQLMKEQKTHPSLRLVFAEFSYCKFKLSNMKLLPTNFQASIPPITRTTSIESKELNILLLGETGVGKSTFINAFINYLAFESIEKAEKDGPIVLIPISFVMANDDQFDEYNVKLGESSNSNEDFDHPGQTITQHCESYIFNFDNDNKLRIIDTPGIGDTRGLSQDDKNIQYILSYVNNLSHLNAICILLKPNTSRLHVLFRSCFEQIFNFLGPNARDNIMFCFTSSRSTFYLPGNTAPLLKKMLNELPADHVPQLSKANMFCFDSESFRYLAANKSQVNIQFKDDQKTDFNVSWNKSVVESIRLINLIKSCPKYQMNTWHSIKHAQIIITSLIRPILETIRYSLRNRILYNAENKQYSIEFQAEYLSQPSYLCTTCPYELIHIKDFPIVAHSVHQYRKPEECNKCQCEYNVHFPILYTLKYNSNAKENNQFYSKTDDMRSRLLQASVKFTHFLLHTTGTNEDLFLPWLDLFIREELYLCSQESSTILNSELYIQLTQLKEEYQKQLNEIKEDKEQINVDEIYQWIEKVQKFEVINKQMNVIRKTQMEMMKYHEHDVSSQYPDINMSLFLTRSITEN